MPKNVPAPAVSQPNPPVAATAPVTPACVSVFLAIVKDGNSLLMGKDKRDCYALPGGKLEEGETLMECAVRELRQELGRRVHFHLASPKIKAVCTLSGQGKATVEPNAQDRNELKLILFGVWKEGEPIQASNEMKRPCFMPFEEVARKAKKDAMANGKGKLLLRPSLRWMWQETFASSKNCWDPAFKPARLTADPQPDLNGLRNDLVLMGIHPLVIERLMIKRKKAKAAA